jgi:hypothetical protein
MCERSLELALHSRDEGLINTALKKPTLLGISSGLIRTYQASARGVIMEILNEAYVGGELSEAVAVGSVEMLKVYCILILYLLYTYCILIVYLLYTYCILIVYILIHTYIYLYTY